MKKLLAFILILLTVSTSAIAETSLMYIVCRDDNRGVNIRAKANPSSDITGHCYLGDLVTVTRTYKGWAYCIDLGTEAGVGWISLDYLVDEPVEVVKTTATVSANGRVALRNSINGKKIRWVDPGEVLNVMAISEEWVILEEGYMKAEFLIIKDPTVEEQEESPYVFPFTVEEDDEF